MLIMDNEKEKTLTANQFAKKAGLYPMQVTRLIQDGKIKAKRETVEKMEYRIPLSELSKV